MKRQTLIRIFLPLFMLCGIMNAHAQENSNTRKLDRERWQQLVDEVNRKRYNEDEPSNKSSERSSEAQNEYRQRERDLYGDSNDSDSEQNGSEEGISGGNETMDEGSESMSDEDFFSDDEEEYRNDSYEEETDPDQKYNNGSGSGDAETREPLRFEQKPERRVAETRPAGSDGGSNTWLFIVLIVILGLAVIYMIIVSFSDRNKKVPGVTEADENKLENLTISKSELELALEAALAAKNYREAVRIYFIAIIKEMKDHNWIRWEKKKTNYHYINEISGRSQQSDFITATRAFEIVWYGNRSLEENEYNRLEPHFKKLLTSIH